ncbi:MAG: Rrf2 family transcriptional regulator [Bacteroidetes bacterium]|nr:Rrf2 family transcriptional regulator [Bacteroidota bacterium]
MFSKACEYGIRASVYIAQKSVSKERCNIKDISKEIDSPEAFTAKILQTLVHAQIIQSVKGAFGGFEITQKNLRKIKLIDIAIAIDGTLYDKTCVLGLKHCSENQPCPVHNQFKHIKKDLLCMMQNTHLLAMSTSVEAGLSCLKIA